MKKHIRAFFDKITRRLIPSEIYETIFNINSIHNAEISIQKETLLLKIKSDIFSKWPESIIQYGYSVYSQNDEDGILEEIFKRLNISTPSFIEFGVHPLENNTLFLLVNNSRGVWIDRGLLNFKRNYDRLHIIDKFVNIENIDEIISEAISYLKIEKNQLDFFSLDLDGNDYYFVKKLYESDFRPKVICLEYNAKFGSSKNITIKYNNHHSYKSDDYFGCSLNQYVELLKTDYTLIVCNITGCNCFFVRNDLAQHFKIYAPDVLYQPPRYYLTPMYKGAKSSLRYLDTK